MGDLATEAAAKPAPAEQAKHEFGRTVADAARLLRKATRVYIAVRCDLKHGDAEYIGISPAAMLDALNKKLDSDFLPSEFRSDDRSLSIGSFRAVEHASETKGRAS